MLFKVKLLRKYLQRIPLLVSLFVCETNSELLPLVPSSSDNMRTMDLSETFAKDSTVPTPKCVLKM